ncbi:MAG: DEAD/DEAH box helicase [Armatimonadota bacterium]|nr:DEAD/DEAH box helicase [Armatimonadota bacterium]
MSLDVFHPLVAAWFRERFGDPTPAQALGWPPIIAGRDTLIASPTGSGKTLAAFLWSLDGLVRSAASGDLADETAVIYVSPLKALGNDIQKNLQEPLAEIRARAALEGTPLPEIRVMVRTGDTPARERDRMARRPPHILITTPESLYILLTAARSRAFCRTARAVIVDEIHAVASDRRGSHLALSLERLDLLAGRRLQRVGLSATVRPVEEVAALLVGAGRLGPDGRPDCGVVDIGHYRPWDLSVHVPDRLLGPVATHELWEEICDRIAALARDRRTTLVFVHTRRLAERVAHQLTRRLGEGRVVAHHGSLSRHLRLEAERKLRAGEASVVVATASLELGIDIGHIDLVCHVGAPRALGTLLQRVGRSGHGRDAVSCGVLFPLTRDELVQCAAAVRAARAGHLDRVRIPSCPLDVLAQQIVAIAGSQEIAEDDLWALVRRAYPYRDLSREQFDQVIRMLAEGISSRRGRDGAWLHRDGVRGVLRGRRGARLAALTCGGAIPDTADYEVVEDPQGTVVGRVNEDFAVESQAGDVFLLGNSSWRIRRVEAGRVRVESAQGAPPSVPFWLGEAPARTAELSAAVSDLRQEVADRLGDPDAAADWLVEQAGVDRAGARQIVSYVAETAAALGCVPTARRVVAERFFDEAGGMQLVLHAPFGGRITRAWGLALRKRFCLTFDFELQAAATDDGIVLSLGEQHSFPLEAVFRFLRSSTARDDLVQAVLGSPLFTTRWRWTATRALAVLRYAGGRRVPMPWQRMRAEDLLAAVFPDQVACQDNRSGPVIPPDHPLVSDTLRQCLHEALDVDGLLEVLRGIERGEIATVAVDAPAPSAMAAEIVHAQPYAFLDDAPLEERRARAVALRRVAPDLAAETGALDPAAVEEVVADVQPPVRDPDELHDLLLSVGVVPLEEAERWREHADALLADGRAAVAAWRDPSGRDRRALVAAERIPLVRSALDDATFSPAVVAPLPRWGAAEPDADEAVRRIVVGWMQIVGPVSADDLADRLGLAVPAVERALAALEGMGVVLRGRFTPAAGGTQWCERRLLARIHRLTVGRLRREIEPVTPADVLRYLLRWQHVQPGTRLHGRDGVLEVIAQLQGLELPAPAWEQAVLPTRVRLYDPADLDALCLSGVVTWGRLSAAPPGEGGRNGSRPSGTTRSSPLAFVLRDDLAWLLPADRDLEVLLGGLPAAAAEVARFLADRGASFVSDIARGVRRMPSEVEEALWVLVSRGVVSGDGVAGLRRLLAGRRRTRRPSRVEGAHSRAAASGRWALWVPSDVGRPPDRVERFARQLLRRYGVVFRELLARETVAPPWRDLAEVYRRWEIRGEIRGGRFVAGTVGEQFALPEAVQMLREVRRAPDQEVVVISAADPLNLVGILLPGERVPPQVGLAVAYRNGAVVGAGPQGALLRQLGVGDPSRR